MFLLSPKVRRLFSFGYPQLLAIALVFLTLLPAIRRGPAYVENNGSPWRWPLFPWVLFGMLALAVPARSFLLCWSMHPVGLVNLQHSVFGPYFLVPFGFVLVVLLLEMGLVLGRRKIMWTALALPAGLILLAVSGQRPDPIYLEFRAFFKQRLGADPQFLTVLISTGFYLVAICRRVPLAHEALTASLAMLAVVGPNSMDFGEFLPPESAIILLASLWQLGLGIWRRQSLRCFLAGCGLLAAIAAAMIHAGISPITSGLIVFHLALMGMLILGAVFDDTLARALRLVATSLLLVAGLAAIFLQPPSFIPDWMSVAYPFAMACILAGYAKVLGFWPGLLFAALIPVSWLLVAGAQGYLLLRQIVKGLDYLAISLALFALAVLISLTKFRRIPARPAKVPDSTN